MEKICTLFLLGFLHINQRPSRRTMCKFCGDIDCRNLILTVKQGEEKQKESMCRKAQRMFEARQRRQKEQV